jgi:hypothetical protein
MNDAFAHYEEGLNNLLEKLSKDSARYSELLVFEQRLRENIVQVRSYGDTETRRADRAQIVAALNQLALEETETNFNELCGFLASRRCLNALLNSPLTLVGLPPDMPLHERLTNLLMTGLGKVGEGSLALMMHLLALLILSVLFACWLARSDQCWANKLWSCLGVLWLGLTILPLIAGFLPQKREKDLQEMIEFTTRQRIALWLDKAFGAYVSAYLVELAATVGWLGLNYVGHWANMSVAGKTVFWLVVEWLAFVLSFVGTVIATKYWKNISESGRNVNLEVQHFLLGLGFPLIVFPAFMLFALVTSAFWRNWQTGSLAIGLSFLVLAWMLGRESAKGSS